MESVNIFDTLSNKARIWVYGFSKPLSEDQILLVKKSLDEFVKSWSAHGESVKGGYDLIENCFAILAVENADIVSGCSIDSSVKVFKNLKLSLGIDALNKSLIYTEINSALIITDRFDFVKKIREGIIDDDILVYDTTIQTLGELRNGGFKKPIKESWHAKLN